MDRRRPASIALLAALAAVIGVTAGHAQSFTLESPDIAPGGAIAEEQVYSGYGCRGGNVSPALRWSGAPEGAKSFALLVHDPDARGGGWWHWLVVDIPAGTTGLGKDAGRADGSRLPGGATHIVTDFGTPGWGGPCPPAGDRPHRYLFTLHALKVDTLGVAKDARASRVESAVRASSLATATLTGMYGRAR